MSEEYEVTELSPGTGEEPAEETPVWEAPAVEEPVIQEPVMQEPAGETPSAEEPVSEQPVMEPFVNEAPVSGTPAPPKKSGINGKIVALALSCTLLGGAMGIGGFALGSHMAGSRGAEDTVPESIETMSLNDREITADGENEAAEGENAPEAPVPGDNDMTVVQAPAESALMTQAEVYAMNVNSTVGITTSITTNFWGYQSKSAASGSGFIISEDGYILTNHHVIEDADSVTITLFDGTTYDARVIGYDENNDIAVLKVDAQDLVPVVLGDSDSVQVGDTVVAIGNPLGELTFSLTSGYISALNRAITMENGLTMDLMQTDAAINSGNSGGALFNLRGEVIGITNAKYSGSGSSGQASIDNIGFAIPINQVKGIVSSIIQYGYIVKPYIGVSVMDVSQEAQNFGLPAGAAVASVVEDGPSAEAGLQANDIITAVNGVEISDRNALVDIVGAASVGDELTLSIYRQGELLEVTVTVREQRQEALPVDQETAEDYQDYQDYQRRPRQQYPSGGFPWDDDFDGFDDFNDFFSFFGF